MENDQVTSTPNAGANHEKKIVPTTTQDIKSESPPAPENKSTPSSISTKISSEKGAEKQGGSTVEKSSNATRKNPDKSAKIMISSDGDGSASEAPPPKKPLVAATANSSRDAFLPPASQAPTKPPASSSRTVAAGVSTTGNAGGGTSSTPKFASAPASSTATSPVAMDENTVQDEKIKVKRRPLTDKYGTYIAAGDTSLADARLRLHTAMEQTRRLRQAFTDRVYKKYKVCLDPVPSTADRLKQILIEPQSNREKLEQEIQQQSEEKTAEKREAIKLNSEMAKAPNRESVEKLANAENADQLMYFSAGLSLIVLPEDDTVDVSKWYAHRAPVHPVTGQRVAKISAAAATAGDVVLDRRRKAALLRNERLSREKSGNSSEYSRLQVLEKNPTFPIKLPPSMTAVFEAPTKEKTSKQNSAKVVNVKTTPTSSAKASGASKPVAAKKGSAKANTGPSAATAKAIRARVQATMSVQTLLSLSPSGEELRSDGRLSAATLALMERGIGTLPSKSHPRHRHPYPDSAGGKRRAMRGTSTGQAASDTAGLAWTLPPLPTVKERRNRKRLLPVDNSSGSAQAGKSIQKVLRLFNTESSGTKRQRVTEIGFLHGIQEFGSKSSTQSMSSESNSPSASLIDPTLALHVMQAVGLVQPADNQKATSTIFPDNLETAMFDVAEKRAMGDDGGVSRRSTAKLKALHERFMSSKGMTFSRNVMKKSLESEQSRAEATTVPIMPIRGGGEASEDSSKLSGVEENGESNKDAMRISNAEAQAPANPDQMHSPQGNTWNDQSRLVLINAGIRSNGTQPIPRLGQYPNIERYHPNTVQLANQLRRTRMPNPPNHAPNEFSDYINSLHPQAASGYDWSAVNAASAAAAASAHSLAALGIAPNRVNMGGFPIQNGGRTMMHDHSSAAAAHAAAAHRQAFAYLSAYQPNVGANILNPVFVNPPGAQQPPISQQQQQGSRSQSQNKPMVVPDTKGGDAKKEATTLSDVQPNLPILEVANSKKRKTAPSEDQKPSSSKQMKFGSAHESGKAEHTTSPPQKVAGVSNKKLASQDSTDRAKAPPKVTTTNKGACKEKEESLIAESTSASARSEAPLGLNFLVPPAPPEVPTNIASMILQAQSHEAASKAGSLERPEKSAVVSYLISVGTAVPIPKTLVSHLLKERLHDSPHKTTPLSALPQSSRDAAVATILLWLWKFHEESFQRAFSKSGRIDVEPECKWLLSAAVNKAIVAVGLAMEDPSSRTTTPLTIALMALKSKSSSQKGSQDKESGNFLTSSIDLLVVSAVAKGLNNGLVVNPQVNSSLPYFQDLLDYVDELRKSALHSKSQERALLAALISRKATMSLSFSHAYVSAMVRAGEALGHGELFEVIQNEQVHVSTMIPYDVFTDESGAWEDPCRPPNGYNQRLTGDDLMRQAHARAMIQKSLKKLQERHNIKGGTTVSGAYVDPPAPSSTNAKSPSTAAVSSRPASLKRRPSFSEAPIQPGTGSAPATNWSLYEPKHLCPPLEWNSELPENTPYGKHDSKRAPRALSVSQFSLKLPPTRGRGKSTKAVNTELLQPIKEPEPDEGPVKRSTREIPWVDIAGIFQIVNGPGTPRQPETPAAPKGRNIFAPIIRQVGLDDVSDNSEDESSCEEEDLRDETVLARHQEVLDRMKEHLSAFFAARQNTSQGQRGRKSS